MWEILPDSGTVRAALEWLAFIVLVILMLGVGFFGLAFGAMGLEKVKREGKKLLGRADVLALGDGIASVNTLPLHHWVDDPNDALIILMAQALRQDPVGMVKQVDKLFTVFGQLQLIWPQIKDGLGLTTLPREARPLAEPLPKPPIETLIT
jgi:hypothetical protein